MLDDALVSRVAQEALARVDQAITFAKQSPLPDPSDATAYVFS